MKNKLFRILLVVTWFLVFGWTASCQSQRTDMPETPIVTTAVPSSIPEALPTATSSIKPTPDADEAQAAIFQALLALNTQPNRMESTTIPDGGQAQTNVIEFVPPDRKRITNPGDGVEYIVIGQVVYAKTSTTGTWEETKIPASTFMGEAEVTEETLAPTVSDAQFVRRDVLDGKAVMVYSYLSATRSGDIELHSQTELWVGEVDGLPYQMTINGEILSASTDPATGETKLQAVPALANTLIAFDTTIIIETPEVSPTPSMVANPTTLRELVQGTDFVVGMKWFTDHPDTFDTVRNHSNGAHLTLFMKDVMPQRPEDLGNPASYNFSWIDEQVRGMNEEKSGTDSIYVSHVVVPHNVNQQLPWLVDLYNSEMAAHGQTDAQAKVNEIMTAYVTNYMSHLRTLMQQNPHFKRVMVSVLGESGIKTENEGDDILLQIMGANYPETLFDAARAAYPEALLGYTANRNWTDGEDGEFTGLNTQGTLEIVNRLYPNGKMDYLGIEGIMDGSKPLDTADMAATLARYNCPIFVPEFQISEQLMRGTVAERDAQQAQMTLDFLSTIAATDKWLGLNFDSIGPYGFLATPNINRPWAGPEANASIVDPVTFQPKIPGAYQAAFEVIKAYLGR